MRAWKKKMGTNESKAPKLPPHNEQIGNKIITHTYTSRETGRQTPWLATYTTRIPLVPHDGPRRGAALEPVIRALVSHLRTGPRRRTRPPKTNQGLSRTT